MGAVTLDKVREVAPGLPSGAAGATLLAAAVEWCEKYCGRKFDRADVSGEVGRSVRDDAPGEIRHIIYLARPPAAGVASVIINDYQLDAELYELLSDGGRADRILVKTYENVPGYATRVSYSGGWANGAAPGGLVLAVATLMARQQDRLQHGAVITEASGGESASYMGSGQFYEDIRQMLKPYKLVRL